MVYMLVAVLLVSSWFLPWWFMCVWLFLFGRWASTPGRAYVSGFFAVFLVWTAVAYYFDIRAHGLIGERLAAMFGLPLSLLVYILSGVLGGLVGAMASTTGFYFFQWWRLHTPTHKLQG